MPFCKYAPATLGRLSCAALIDSGNVYRTVISEEFAKKLRINVKTLKPLDDDQVQTAQKNSPLHILGEVKHALQLKFFPENDDAPASFYIKPAVVRDLGMDLNISGPFLKRFGIDQIHTKDALRLKDGRLVKLLEVPSGEEVPKEIAEVALRTEKRIRVPPRSMIHFKIKASKEIAGKEGIVQGNEKLLASIGLMPWVASLVEVDTCGMVPAGLLNPTNKGIYLPKGARYGNWQPAGDLDDREKRPWRIACLRPPQRVAAAGVPNKPTVREKMEEIVRKMEKDGPKPKPEPPKVETKKQKLEWLEKAFRFDQSPPLQKDPKLKTALLQLLLRYWDVISVNGEFGSTTLLEHEIHTGNTQPIKCKQRMLNPALEADLKRQLDDNLERGVIEPSSSPWSFPLVAAPKKNKAIRWCVDYRRLNIHTSRDVFPLPSIEANIARLAKSKIFSTLDGAGAFHVIPIRKRDRKKTAFSTPWGLFQYRKMPFGLCNGPASYSRLVQLMLHGIPPSMAMPYLDDIIVHSTTPEEHLAYLEVVLEAHRHGGLKLQPAKCELFRYIVNYLGHRVSGDGVQTQPGIMQRVKEWTFPKNKSDLRVFLGLANYYRKFVKGFSGIASPLTELTGKGSSEEEKAVIEETADRRQAFEELKMRLLQAPILAYPHFDKDAPPFILDTDWSQDNNAIGGVLSQEQDSKERVILYGGKKMSAAQRNYTSFKGELAALLFFAKTWDFYLERRHFIVRTDHEPLVHLHTMHTPDRHVLRMLAVLADLDFTVKYRPGPKHGNADALSRAPYLRDEPDAKEDVAVDTEDDERRLNASHREAVQAICSLQSPLDPDGRFSKEAVRIAQGEDDDLEPLLEHLRQNTEPSSLERQAWSPESRHYWGKRHLLHFLDDGLLYYQKPKGDEFSKKHLVILPRIMWNNIIRKIHQLSGHSGPETTAKRLLRTFYIPRALVEVQDVIRLCHECKLKVASKPKQKGTLVSVLDGFPFQRVSVDFIGPITPPARGYHYILTARDCFSKWLEAFPVRRADADTAIDKLVNEVFRRYGVPEQLHSDKGTHFTAATFEDTAKRLKIQHTTTPAYNPKSNPVERAHRNLGEMVRALQADNGQSWVVNLPAAVMAINTNVHVGTQYSAFQLLFGRDPPLPLSLVYGDPELNQRTDEASYARAMGDRLHSAFQHARHNLKAAVARRRKNYRGHTPIFKEGEKVYLCSPALKQTARFKGALDWSGPWTVTKVFSPLLLEIVAPTKWRLRKNRQIVSVDRLLHFPENGEQLQPDGDLPQWEQTGDEAIERPPPMAQARRGRRQRVDAERGEARHHMSSSSESEDEEVTENWADAPPEAGGNSPRNSEGLVRSEPEDVETEEQRQPADEFDNDATLFWDPSAEQPLPETRSPSAASEEEEEEARSEREIEPANADENEASDRPGRSESDGGGENEIGHSDRQLRAPENRISTRRPDFVYFHISADRD